MAAAKTLSRFAAGPLSSHCDIVHGHHHIPQSCGAADTGDNAPYVLSKAYGTVKTCPELIEASGLAMGACAASQLRPGCN